MTVKIQKEHDEHNLLPLLRMPFRPLFLLIAAYSCIALAIWTIYLSTGFGSGSVDVYWHQHEMIFGFAATTVVGFVLTASQTWTGVRTLHGLPLGFLVLMWVCARVVWFLPVPYGLLGGLFDGLFFLLAGLALSRQIVAARNWRNAFFIFILAGLAVASVFYSYTLWQQDYGLAGELLTVIFFLIVHVVLVVGGRVIPFFSDRGLGREPTPKPLWLERLALGSSLLFMLMLVTGFEQGFELTAALVALTNGVRWLQWKPWDAKGVAILWSLHVAYALVVSGFVALALDVPYSSAIHLIAIGGFGLMILAMISRVSLGHSGRPLALPPHFQWAYWAIIVAVISRFAANLVLGYYTEMLVLSAIFWITGFGLFLWFYFPMLTTPRADGNPKSVPVFKW